MRCVLVLSLVLVLSALCACGGPQTQTVGVGAEPEEAAEPVDSPGDEETPTPTVAGGPSAAADLAEAFWERAGAGDIVGVLQIVGFPFTWDGRCRMFTTPERIRQAMEGDPIPEDFVMGSASELQPGAPVARPEIGRSLVSLASPVGDCGDEADAHIAQAAQYERRFFFVSFAVRGSDVGAVTRVSLIDGRWRVTGIDN